MSPIPWTAILTHGPAIVGAAKRLLATTGTTTTRQENQTIDGRIDRLEKTSMESARLLGDIAQQVQALAIAQEQTARRVRIAMVLSVTAIIVGIGAGILVLAW